MTSEDSSSVFPSARDFHHSRQTQIDFFYDRSRELRFPILKWVWRIPIRKKSLRRHSDVRPFGREIRSDLTGLYARTDGLRGSSEVLILRYHCEVTVSDPPMVATKLQPLAKSEMGRQPRWLSSSLADGS